MAKCQNSLDPLFDRLWSKICFGEVPTIPTTKCHTPWGCLFIFWEPFFRLVLKGKPKRKAAHFGGPRQKKNKLLELSFWALTRDRPRSARPPAAYAPPPSTEGARRLAMKLGHPEVSASRSRIRLVKSAQQQSGSHQSGCSSRGTFPILSRDPSF